MRGNDCNFVGREAGSRDGFLADQPIGEFLKDGFFSVAGVATETRLDRIEVFHQEVAEGGAGGEHSVGCDHLFFVHHVHLGISLLLRLDQLIRLVEPWIFHVMFAQRNALNSEQAYFHLSVVSFWSLHTGMSTSLLGNAHLAR